MRLTVQISSLSPLDLSVVCATSTDAASPHETVAFIGVLAAVMQAGSVVFRDDSTACDRPTPRTNGDRIHAIAIARSAGAGR